MADRFEGRVLDGLVGNNFTIDELQTLCLRLGVNPERVASPLATLDTLARELIGHTGRRGQWPELIAQLRAERPHVPSPDACIVPN